MKTHHYQPLSEDEYLDLESRSSVRHEYVNGDVFAMTGGTLRHNTVAGNLFAALKAHLRDTPCQTFVGDVRVRVAKTQSHYYPDVLVRCPGQSSDVTLEASVVEDPVLIIEVLSPSTEGQDRREKLLAYRTLPSLAEYVLVSQDRPYVEIHRRHGDIGWERIEHAGPEIVHLASVQFDLPMRDIFEGVPMEALERGPEE